ncbi:sunset domain-containing protein [Deinococcus cellulosilyticus]|uniref:sunset domain-containing protein n=1 Tax=Deinococcus cellulosilyticus TaxID=401558 RepID=UPI003FCCEBD0
MGDEASAAVCTLPVHPCCGPGVVLASRTACTSNHPSKRTINSKGEKIKHLPSGACHNRTHPERCFNTPQKAQKAGFRASKR